MEDPLSFDGMRDFGNLLNMGYVSTCASRNFVKKFMISLPKA